MSSIPFGLPHGRLVKEMQTALDRARSVWRIGHHEQGVASAQPVNLVTRPDTVIFSHGFRNRNLKVARDLAHRAHCTGDRLVVNPEQSTRVSGGIRNLQSAIKPRGWVGEFSICNFQFAIRARARIRKTPAPTPK